MPEFRKPLSDPTSLTMAFALIRTARAYRAHINQALAELGLSQIMAWTIIIVGRSDGGVRQKEVADELGIEPPSLVRLVDELEASGVIQRRDDPNDRRFKTLHLTDSGNKIYADADKLLARVRRRLFADITQEDADAFLRVLATLNSELNSPISLSSKKTSAPPLHTHRHF